MHDHTEHSVRLFSRSATVVPFTFRPAAQLESLFMTGEAGPSSILPHGSPGVLWFLERLALVQCSAGLLSGNSVSIRA